MERFKYDNAQPYQSTKMTLEKVVEEIRKNNAQIIELESRLVSDNPPLFVQLKHPDNPAFKNYPSDVREKILKLHGLEDRNFALAIEGLNFALDMLGKGQELDGTYWGAGEDYVWSGVKGVNRFQGVYEADFRSTRKKIRDKEIELVNFEFPAETHPFDESSQNFAFQKTFGRPFGKYHPDIIFGLLWEEMIYTLKPGSLIVVTHDIPQQVKDRIVRIEDGLHGFNGLRFNWIRDNIGVGYSPPKFDFYMKK
ncbi:MAG: hypothetical protein AABX63_05055 [Nanoarchaeota archaeon]